VIRSGWGSALPRRLMIVAVAVLIPVLAGCEAGDNAPTLDFHYPTDAAGVAVGNLSIRNAFVLGARLGSTLSRGQSASLFLAIVNDGAPDKLLSITAPGSATSVTVPGGTVPISYGHPVFFTGPRPQLILVGLTRTIRSGSNLRLVLTFQKAGLVTLLVPVMPRATSYVTFAPPPLSASPSASPSATAGKHHRARPTPTTSPSPGATPSPSPSPSPTG
jgi:copper(I)-binding protein